jgi:hypothetical protein
VHVPCATNVTVPPDVVVHTPDESDVNDTGKPLVADAIDATENESSPNVFVPPV